MYREGEFYEKAIELYKKCAESQTSREGRGAALFNLGKKTNPSVFTRFR